MRKSFLVTAILIAAALGSLLVLAFNQFQLYGRHEQIINQTEKILFQYSNIREQIVENIVEGRIGELSRVSPAVEELHNNLLKILDNKLIPTEYKFSLLQQIDLPGLVLLLRKSGVEEDKATLLRRINEESRVIGERFMLFERLVLGHAKQKLVDFQSIIIGILALVVFLVTTLMIVTYRLLIAPVINLSIQSKNLISGHQDIIHRPQGWEEVSGLSDKLNTLAYDLREKRDEAARYEQIVECVQEVMRKALDASERGVLYQAVCRKVLSNPDYVLAWIGIEDVEEQEIMPMVVDGSSMMSCDECQECFSALLAAQEEENPVNSSFVSGETVLMTDVLAKAPKGPFKNTPLADGKVTSVSLPLVFNGKKYGVLTIYSICPEEISDTEVKLLAEMATLIAGKEYSLEFADKMDAVLLERKIISKYGEILSFTLDEEGNVRTAKSYKDDSEYSQALSSWVGSSVTEVVMPENESEQIVFRDSITGKKQYDFKAKLAGFDEQFSATLQPLKEFPAEQEALLLILVAPPQDLLLQPENFKIAYSAAIGQFAGSVAHDITDMSNGIINYAQMMSDELNNDESEKKENLSRIIDKGEKIAASIEPLLIDQDDLEFTRNMENIQEIFDDVMLLVDPQFKRNSILVNLSIQPTSLTFKKQHVQLILFDLLKRLGDILNSIYPQKDEGKVMDISVTPFYEEGKKMVLVRFEFPSVSEEEAVIITRHRALQGIWLSQELARALGGEVTISKSESGIEQVELLLPS